MILDYQQETMRKDVYNVEIEKQVLASILKYPNKFFEVSDVITDEDFYDKESLLHVTIFRVLKSSLEKRESVDPVVVYEKIKSKGISFQDPVDILLYLKSLQVRYINEEDFINICRELKKQTVRRKTLAGARKVGVYALTCPEEVGFSEFVDTADRLFNSVLGGFDTGEDDGVEIFEGILPYIESIADDPNKHVMTVPCPYKHVEEVYGSLLQDGGMSVIVSRTGVGKTTFTMDYCLKSSKMSGIPVLHFDNGEMSAQELMLRQAAAVTGVDHNLFKKGKWRNVSPEKVKEVRDLLTEYSKLKYTYYNIAGMTADEMCAKVMRHYYTKVGRGKRMIFLFDYIKPPGGDGRTSEWTAVGEMVNKLKQVIHKKIQHEKKPMISMMTSVQANRSGIVGSKSGAEVIDDESIVSLSDRISHYCSHLLVLRRKTLDEIMTDGQEFGTHKLIGNKARELGENPNKYLHPVKMPDGSFQKYYICFDFDNFGIEEVGDLTEIAAKLATPLKQGPVQTIVPDSPKKSGTKKNKLDKNSEGVYTPQLSLTDAAEKESPESTPA